VPYLWASIPPGEFERFVGDQRKDIGSAQVSSQARANELASVVPSLLCDVPDFASFVPASVQLKSGLDPKSNFNCWGHFGFHRPTY
jgi:hypothetical protein